MKFHSASLFANYVYTSFCGVMNKEGLYPIYMPKKRGLYIVMRTIYNAHKGPPDPNRNIKGPPNMTIRTQKGSPDIVPDVRKGPA